MTPPCAPMPGSPPFLSPRAPDPAPAPPWEGFWGAPLGPLESPFLGTGSPPASPSPAPGPPAPLSRVSSSPSPGSPVSVTRGPPDTHSRQARGTSPPGIPLLGNPNWAQGSRAALGLMINRRKGRDRRKREKEIGNQGSQSQRPVPLRRGWEPQPQLKMDQRISRLAPLWAEAGGFQAELERRPRELSTARPGGPAVRPRRVPGIPGGDPGQFPGIPPCAPPALPRALSLPPSPACANAGICPVTMTSLQTRAAIGCQQRAAPMAEPGAAQGAGPVLGAGPQRSSATAPVLGLGRSWGHRGAARGEGDPGTGPL